MASVPSVDTPLQNRRPQRVRLGWNVWVGLTLTAAAAASGWAIADAAAASFTSSAQFRVRVTADSPVAFRAEFDAVSADFATTRLRPIASPSGSSATIVLGEVDYDSEVFKVQAITEQRGASLNALEDALNYIDQRSHDREASRLDSDLERANDAVDRWQAIFLERVADHRRVGEAGLAAQALAAERLMWHAANRLSTARSQVKHLKVERSLAQGAIEILDISDTASSSGPSRQAYAAAGALTAFTSLALFDARSRSSRRLKSYDEIAAAIRPLPVLGEVRLRSEMGNLGQSPKVQDDLRAIRASLVAQHRSRPATTIALLPLEDRIPTTTFALLVATSIARGGDRTVLVSASRRDAELGRAIGKPGLQSTFHHWCSRNALLKAGEATINLEARLDLLGADFRHDQAQLNEALAELSLASIGHPMTALRSLYQWTIVGCRAVDTTAETHAVLHHCDAAIVLVEYSQTTAAGLSLQLAAVEQLVPVAGVVVIERIRKRAAAPEPETSASAEVAR